MKVFFILAVLCAPFTAGATEAPSDADALSLADETKPTNRARSDWQLFGEASIARTLEPVGDTARDSGRLSIDLRFDGVLRPGLRGVLSNRLDVTHIRPASVRDTSVNTLREAYLSWQVAPDLIADAGRVNLRYGAAWGYNPTDYFKVGALRSIVSPDPVSLRDNRQGTFVLLGQKLWSESSFTALASPKLGDDPSGATFSLDAASTNPRDRWLVAVSHKFGDGFSPQALLHGGAGMSPQVGINVSSVAGTSAVAFLEASFGKGPMLASQALGSAESERVQQRAAAGATFTTAFDLSMTAEIEFNSAAPNRRQWNALTNRENGDVLRVLGLAQSLQELPVRHAFFAYAVWRNAGVSHFDISAFVRRETVTRSRAQWVEARYRLDSAEVALQWQGYSGAAKSLFRVAPQPRRVDFVLRYYI